MGTIDLESKGTKSKIKGNVRRGTSFEKDDKGKEGGSRG